MKHMQHQMKHTFEKHENIRSSMPLSDEKIWASKQRLQMWARAFTNRQAAWPALQLANPVGQSSNAGGSWAQTT
jgi:hypothetical protein